MILDDAPFPDEDLELMLRPNPTGFKLITESVVTGSTALIQIEVRILYIHVLIITIIIAGPVENLCTAVAFHIHFNLTATLYFSRS